MINKSNLKYILLFAGCCAVVLVTLLYMILSQSASVDTPEAQHTPAPPPVHTDPSGYTPLPLADGLNVAPSALGDLTVTPLSLDAEGGRGVQTDSQFLIQTAYPLTEADLQGFISVKSGEAFTLAQQPDNTFLLSFAQELEYNRVYSIVYDPPDKQAMSYAFQTVDVFRVTATTPGHDTYQVPSSTGVEVTFSRALGGSFESHFEIHPPVGGTFATRGNTHIFMPWELAPSTRYTVTVKSGLVCARGDVLKNDYVFYFNTAWQDMRQQDMLSINGDVYETFLPWDDVFVELNVNEALFEHTFDVRVYDLHDPEVFINYTRASLPLPLSDFRLVEELQAPLHIVNPTEQWYRYYYILLQKPLPEGYYLIDISAEEGGARYNAQKLIQVSALSVYSLSVMGETVFWVHDAAGGHPAHNARVTMGGTTVATDMDGVARMHTQRGNDVTAAIDYADYPRFVYANQTYDPTETHIHQKYHRFIYTDRLCYKPTDMIDVFIAIKPRMGYSLSHNDVIMVKVGNMYEYRVQLDAYGIATLRIPVEGMFGDASITVELNGERLMSRRIRFLEYTKYSYVLNGETDRKAYFADEAAQVTIAASTVVDAPVEGLLLSSDDTRIITNALGLAQGEVKVPSWRWTLNPYWNTLIFNVVNESDMSQSVFMPVVVAPTDTIVEFERADEGAVTFSAYRVDMASLEAYAQANHAYAHLPREVYRGADADVQLTIEITRNETLRTEKGQSYDFINKRVITLYNYEQTQAHYRTLRATVSNGRLVLDDLPTSDNPLVYYWAQVFYTDTQGRDVGFYMYYDNYGYFYPDESSIKHFRLLADGSTSIPALRRDQTATLTLEGGTGHAYWSDGVRQPITGGRVLAVSVRDQIESIQTGSPTGLDFTFREQHISNAYIFGAYFDGQYIYPISYPLMLRYDYSERDMQIDLTFDREGYRPGDTVTVQIRATDASGSPAQGLICLSVVDETAILDGGNQAEFLQLFYPSTDFWLYNYLYGSMYFEYASHRQHNFGGASGGAEMGDDGSMGYDLTIRNDFTDNPVFMTLETDENGFAQATFELVDTITSWRVTALGITRDGTVGDTKQNILSSLPFYIDLIATNEYLTGDQMGGLVKAYGTAYRRNQTEVLYNIDIVREDESVYHFSVVSSDFVTFDAGRLAEGEYLLRVTADAGAHKDGMEIPFAVVSSPHKLPMVSRQRLDGERTELDALDYRALPVRVTLSNADIWPVMSVLQSVIDPRSHRTDYQAATAFAEYFFDDFFGHIQGTEDYARRLRIELAQYFGIPELVYDTPQLEYTARFAACFPEFVTRASVLPFVESQMRFNNHNHPNLANAIRLYALAALGEPVLLEVYEQAERMREINLRRLLFPHEHYMEVLYYAAALCVMGDYAGAAALAALTAEYPRGDPPGLQSEAMDTLLLFVNTHIDPQAAYAYLISPTRQNIYISDVPEIVHFFKTADIKGRTVSEVTYRLGGETHTARLEHFGRRHLHLTHEQFAALNLRQVSGATDAVIRYYSGNAHDLPADEKRIGIRKSIQPQQDIFRVSFDINMPLEAERGMYKIYDRLPSNLRFVPGGAAVNTERQLVEVWFYYDKRGENRFTISYDAMRVFDAQSEVGQAFVSNGRLNGHLWGATE